MAAEQPETEEGTEPRPEQGDAHSVGALLKASRLRVGEELEEIADILRIRYVYLEAIEDGRFDELPGATYATGFIRAYADHLGLDSDEVVRRFKNRDAAGGPETSLDFPEPIPEPGIPGGAIVFVGIVVAVVAYGAWYINTAKDGLLVELISPLPERLAPPAPAEPAQPAPGLEPPEVTELPGSAETGAASTPGTAEETEAAATAEPAPEAAPQAGPEPAAEPESEPETATETAARPDAASGETETPPETPAEAQPAPQPETAATETASMPAAETPAAAEPEPSPETPAAERAAPAAAEPAPPAAEPAPPAETAAESGAEPAPPADVPFAEVYPPPATEAEAPAPEAPAAEASASPPTAPEQAPAQGAQAVPVDLIPAASPAPDPAETAAVPIPAPAESPAAETPAAAEPEPAPGAGEAPTAPVAAAAPGGAGRIVVRARTNSWIQVRDDAGGALLVTRLLRAGDSYAVPDRPGLRLSTGNAGALVILVDGEAVPAIGGEGSVRRNVALDAEKLKAGTAVSE